MPWKKSEPMDQRREFALKALGTLNFGAICQEYGISTIDRLIRKITEGTNGCIVTSPRSWNAWVKERRPRHWSCGESSSTASAHMKRWGCVARRNCTATRPDATGGLKCN